MHVSDWKDETLFLYQILLLQLLQCVLASQQFFHRNLCYGVKDVYKQQGKFSIHSFFLRSVEKF